MLSGITKKLAQTRVQEWLSQKVWSTLRFILVRQGLEERDLLLQTFDNIQDLWDEALKQKSELRNSSRKNNAEIKHWLNDAFNAKTTHLLQI